MASGEFDITGWDADVVQGMVQFFYSGDYKSGGNYNPLCHVSVPVSVPVEQGQAAESSNGAGNGTQGVTIKSTKLTLRVGTINGTNTRYVAGVVYNPAKHVNGTNGIVATAAAAAAVPNPNPEVENLPEPPSPPPSDDLFFHARMFALAHAFQIDSLQTLAATKYSRELGRGSTTLVEILGSLPVVYNFTPSNIRTLRDKATNAVRMRLKRKDSKKDEEYFLGVYDRIAAQSPEFIKDLLFSQIRAPLLGTCNGCTGEHEPQPVEPVELRCLTCGKGGARPWV